MSDFGDLLQYEIPRLRRYARALTRDATRAADLAQESYLQIHRSRRTYDARFPVRPWMLAIARHVVELAVPGIGRHRSSSRLPVVIRTSVARAWAPVESIA